MLKPFKALSGTYQKVFRSVLCKNGKFSRKDYICAA